MSDNKGFAVLKSKDGKGGVALDRVFSGLKKSTEEVLSGEYWLKLNSDPLDMKPFFKPEIPE